MKGPRSCSFIQSLRNVVACVLLLVRAQAFFYYVPERHARTFRRGDTVPIFVNKLTSIHNPHGMEYYDLPFCRPSMIENQTQNFGQTLQGDHIQNSPYVLRFMQPEFCQQLCVSTMNEKMVDAIENEYHTNFILDNLPAASKFENDEYVTTRYWQGSPIGHRMIIYNHFNIEVYYSESRRSPDSYHIVRFIVEHFSIQHEWSALKGNGTKVQILDPIASCASHGDKRQQVHTNYDMLVSKGQRAEGEVLFTYDVIWVDATENIPWKDRWNVYLTLDNAIPDRVHRYSIINTLIVLGWISVVLHFLWRWMVSDMVQYRLQATNSNIRNPDENEELGLDQKMDRLICCAFCGVLHIIWRIWRCLVLSGTSNAREEAGGLRGWKAVQRDVFRPPNLSPMLLAVTCGTGAHLLGAALITIGLCALGLFSSAYRGYLVMASIAVLSLTGWICGYVTALYYKAFHGEKWTLCMFSACLFFPGLVSVTFLIVRGAASDTLRMSIPINVALWLGVMFLLTIIGFYLGKRRRSIRFPIRPGATPRPIPGHPLLNTLLIIPLSILGCGMAPFGAIFVECYYVMAAIWMGYFYYSFGYLFIVLCLTCLTCAVVAIIMTYFQLRLEDYRWWWRSFLNGGAIGVYLFFYSLVFYSQLQADTTEASVLFFSCMGFAAVCVCLMMGFVGVSASMFFTKLIYGAGIDEGDETDEPLVGAHDATIELPAVS